MSVALADDLNRTCRCITLDREALQRGLVAARLYQGQTTNFRTAGGGFAPVFTENVPA